MRRFIWFYPGMKVKRYILVLSFGVIMTAMGFAIIISEGGIENNFGGSLVILIGIASIIIAIRKIVKSFVNVFLPEQEEKVVDLIYRKRLLERGPKIVAIGGGTGLSTLLVGLKRYTSNITAIVTVTDDGGSSGRLRREMNVLPPGDIRNCLVALADTENLMQDLFQYRFTEEGPLQGHNFGNLFITALSKVTGDFEQAIKESSKVLAIRGRVIPSTLKTVTLSARHRDGSVTMGETSIVEKANPIERVELVPGDCKPTEEALDAIIEADAVVIGPGSLYTSLIPNLLVEGLPEQIVKSRAMKIYVCNVMTQHGETDGYKAGDHVRSLIAHSHPRILTHCIINTAQIPEEMRLRYEKQQAYPVIPDGENIEAMGYEVIRADIISTQNFVRHDARKLAKIIFNLITGSRT